jgi:hypothetical protein
MGRVSLRVVLVVRWQLTIGDDVQHHVSRFLFVEIDGTGLLRQVHDGLGFSRNWGCLMFVFLPERKRDGFACLEGDGNFDEWKWDWD